MPRTVVKLFDEQKEKFKNRKLQKKHHIYVTLHHLVSFLNYFILERSSMKRMAAAQSREKAEQREWMKAGRGAIVKTYPYNPKLKKTSN